MKKKELLIAIFLICAIFGFTVLNFEKSYSYGYHVTIAGTKVGSRTLKYYDEDNKEISIDKAIKEYGATRYQEMLDSNGSVYFYNGKEISESKYKVGHAGEEADARAKQYGTSGIRVSTTDEFKKAWDDTFLKYKTGEVAFVWSPYDNIDFKAVDDYVRTKYGVLNPRQNYYTFSIKGQQEPIRFSLELASFKEQGIYKFNNIYTRYTGDEKAKVDKYLELLLNNGILPPTSASEYRKIKAAYDLIRRSVTGGNDGGNDALSSYTSMYDALLIGKSDCIGRSITFAYIMQRYGIETYMIDNIASVDEASKSFSSTHTYNIVKLGGKFYILDLDAGQFLKGGSVKLVPSKSITFSTSNYTPSAADATYSLPWDQSKMQSYKNTALNTSVTVTTKRALTTIKPTTPNTNTKKTTTQKEGNNQDKTTTTTAYTGVTGTGIVIINPGTTTPSTISSSTSSSSISSIVTSKQPESKDSEDKSLVNTIMIGAIVLIIVGYIIYKVVSSRNKKSSSSIDAQAILNRDIIRTEEDNQNSLNNMNNLSNDSSINGINQTPLAPAQDPSQFNDVNQATIAPQIVPSSSPNPFNSQNMNTSAEMGNNTVPNAQPINTNIVNTTNDITNQNSINNNEGNNIQ